VQPAPPSYRYRQLCVGLTAADKRDKLNLWRKSHHAEDQGGGKSRLGKAIAGRRRGIPSGAGAGGKQLFFGEIRGI